ncbi:hypothetical protein LMG28688_03490 [Paraburkholderia caffeinitolerans]|uniref:Lipoprotein n=1 Tax=Paraburkholderia caffeinitolerans TaxID=1723730 RepID=A0A6J5G3X0_9BURK|nr:hypothetical protein [Paraburkholderia caffeinitolerans]CAB3792349.1 hypothetical protein LMG28688_03490 [Paraburkholderia caffeinitolerans]
MKDLIAVIRRALAIVPLVAALGGCMTSTPIWDAHFGEAVHTAIHAQIIDPDAAQHTASTPGIDGSAAAAAMTNYTHSFEKPPSANDAYTLGISGGTSH